MAWRKHDHDTKLQKELYVGSCYRTYVHVMQRLICYALTMARSRVDARRYTEELSQVFQLEYQMESSL